MTPRQHASAAREPRSGPGPAGRQRGRAELGAVHADAQSAAGALAAALPTLDVLARGRPAGRHPGDVNPAGVSWCPRPRGCIC